MELEITKKISSGAKKSKGKIRNGVTTMLELKIPSEVTFFAPGDTLKVVRTSTGLAIRKANISDLVTFKMGTKRQLRLQRLNFNDDLQGNYEMNILNESIELIKL